VSWPAEKKHQNAQTFFFRGANKSKMFVEVAITNQNFVGSYSAN
jgi:hypothetical protein